MCPVSRHSFGYDSGRRANLQLLDETTLIFIAGNILVLIDTETKDQKYLRSCSGGGIGCVAVRWPHGSCWIGQQESDLLMKPKNAPS